MFDPLVRSIIDPPLNNFSKKLIAVGLTANLMTLIGFSCGIMAIIAIIFQQYYLGAIFIIANRLADGLDGAIARQSQITDFGGFLDIVCDFIIYAGIVFSFGLAQTEKLLYANLLIFSFVGPMTSFLAYAIIAGKRKITTYKRGKKSFYYLGGICEGTETAIILILLCLLPSYFNIICLIFSFLCWLTTIGRIYRAFTDFG